jgi:hypothetical protein
MVPYETFGFISAHWTFLSSGGYERAALVVMWPLLSADTSWIATTGLVATLVVMLIGGIVLLVLGASDLVRDMRHHPHRHAEGSK